MTTVNEDHTKPKEQTEGQAICSKCGKSILLETTTSGGGVSVPHRTVRGSFVQFIGSDGEPFGPWWAFCDPCVTAGKTTNPIEHPEVMAAYSKMRKQ